MNKATFDFDVVGAGRLSVYIPVNTETKELRSELKRVIGKPSAVYARRGVIAEEWFIDNGKAVYAMLCAKASWQAVFGGKQTQNSAELGQVSVEGGTI